MASGSETSHADLIVRFFAALTDRYHRDRDEPPLGPIIAQSNARYEELKSRHDFTDASHISAREAVHAILALPSGEPADAQIRMRAALLRVREWAHAYPFEVFPEPDLKAAREKLGDAEMSKLHAAWGRHILAGVARIVNEGLADAN